MDADLENRYFSSVNHIYKGIIKEKQYFSSLLGDQWDSLPVEERDALLDEHFVSPLIAQKYINTETSSTTEIPTLYPVMKIKCGQRIVEDDEGELWQDEHSGPFSWETLSQSEFSLDDDMTCTETIKTRAKDPKRPKSPRLMRNGSGEQLALRPGSLERSGSSDFQQLRHIWEAHHSVTPDSEMPPSFLSRSQSSLNGELSTFSKLLSNSVHSITEREDEADEEVNVVESEARVPEPRPASDEQSTTTSVKTNAAPLASKEVDDDITGSMQDDILKMSEIKAQLEETMADEPTANPVVADSQPANPVVADSQPANPISANSESANSGKEDILAKFGVTFSYSKEDKTDGAVHSKEEEEESSKDASADPGIPSGFDFLSSW